MLNLLIGNNANKTKGNNMKTLLATAAIIAAASTAAADINLSDRNDGLTKRVICSNVPARSGSVSGFFIPTVGYFVAEAAAEYATVDATVVPASVDVKNGAEVASYLQSIGLTNFALQIDTSKREVIDGEVVSINIPAYREGFCK